jgi:predicted MFS family arabinose efflux permease
VWSIGSLAGGQWFSTRAAGLDEREILRYYQGMLVFAALASLALPLMPGVVAMIPALLVVGFSVAPLVACLYLILRGLAPTGAIAEAYAWIITAVYGGAAIGAACAGVLAEHHGARALFAVVAASVLAAIVPAALRQTLIRDPPPLLDPAEIDG